MTDRIEIRGIEREFDPQRYAYLVIALAKELASQEPVPPKRRRGRPRKERRS